MRSNVKWAAAALRTVNYLIISISYEAANQGVIQAARLIEAAFPYRNLNGNGSVQVLVNGVALGNATNFTSSQLSLDFQVTQSALAAANLSTLFTNGSRINVTFSVASFVANVGANTDLLLPAVLTHTFAEINSTNVSPRVTVRDAVLQRAAFVLSAGRPNLVLTLNNALNVTGRVRVTIRHASNLVPIQSTLAALRASGSIVSWDNSVAGKLDLHLDNLATLPVITYIIGFQSVALPAVVTLTTSVNVGSVTVVSGGNADTINGLAIRLA